MWTLLFLLASGCASASGRIPELEMHLAPEGPVLRIHPAADARTGTTEPRSFWVWIPGTWSGREKSPRPELELAVGRVISDELRGLALSSGLFSAVRRVQDSESRGPDDLYLDITLQALDRQQSTITYAVGPLAVVPWVLGFPTGSTKTDFAIRAAIVTADTPPEIIWESSLVASRKHLNTLYNQGLSDDERLRHDLLAGIRQAWGLQFSNIRKAVSPAEQP